MANITQLDQIDLDDISQTDTQSNHERENIPSNKGKYFLTFVYCLVFWNFGLCVAIFGPTLLDLACRTSSFLGTMSALYFMQNLAAMIGVFLSGILLKNNRITVLNFLLICALLMPAFVALMALSKSIFFLGLVMIFLGFNMGCIDNVCNLGIMKLHSSNVSPYLQTMHFFYGVGAVITPLIVQPFLNTNFDIKMNSSDYKCYNIEDVIVNENRTNATTSSEAMTIDAEYTSNTIYAFWILALIQLPAAVILLLLKLKKNSLIHKQTIERTSSAQGIPFQFTVQYFKARLAEIPLKQLTFLVSAIVFLFEGLQASHGGYIFSYLAETYDLKPEHLDAFKNSTNDQRVINRHQTPTNKKHNDEAYITALFWAFFSIGRLASVFIAMKVSASFMVFVDIMGCFISTGLICFSGLFRSIGLLYVGTCLLGLFLSNTTPTVYSLVEIFIGSNPTSTAFVILCAASGEMILPVIVANLFDTYGPQSLLVVELILTILALLFFAKFIHYARNKLNCFDSIISFVKIQRTDDQISKRIVE